MDAPNQKTGEYQLAVRGDQPDTAALDIIRTETVLSKLPIHNLAKKGRVDIRIVKTTPTGAVELKWEVSYNERYGQARQLAYKLDTIIINRRIDEQGTPLPEIIRIGSLNEICEELGSQKNELKRALQQNATTAINAKLMYKGNDGTERQLEALFTRYSVIFTGEKLPSGKKADAVYIILNKPYREVLDNAPTRPLDREYMKELPPAAQRFYEIISYKIYSALKYNHPSAKIAYSEYCTFSAQHRSLDWEFVRPQMYQVHQPHVRSGYLVKPIRHEATTDSEGNLDWIFYYTPGPKARAEFAAAHPSRKKIPNELGATRNEEIPRRRERRARQGKQNPSSESRQPNAVNADLLTALTSRGVTIDQAREHLANLPATYPLIDTLEWADAEIAKNPGKWNNSAGWYVSLVKGTVTPPPTWETRTQREARLDAERRRQEEREAEQARLDAEEQAEDKRLDDLQASDPERYQTLYRKCEDALHQEFPNIGRWGKTDSALNIGAIRARMKRLIKAQTTTQQGSDTPLSFLKPVAELAVAGIAPTPAPEVDPDNAVNAEASNPASAKELAAASLSEAAPHSAETPEAPAAVPTQQPELEPSPAIEAAATGPIAESSAPPVSWQPPPPEQRIGSIEPAPL